jgi:hypothetical protein
VADLVEVGRHFIGEVPELQGAPIVQARKLSSPGSGGVKSLSRLSQTQPKHQGRFQNPAPMCSIDPGARGMLGYLKITAFTGPFVMRRTKL